MSRRYTKHQLTDSMLQRLSAICNGRKHKHGNALIALEQRGLVVEANQSYAYCQPGRYEATEEGHRALDCARREGW